ncbi:MAG: hypothetical protein KDA24_18800 [Deltaproteobacteria bacterium]|nr:hypothetical protein [Deltaproteobacteria bacterium]
MARWLLPLLWVPLAGCPLIYGDDDDSASGGEAPRIESSFPGPASQELLRGEDITFSARGSDGDSLELTWSFTLDDGFVAGGTVDDGAFDVSWVMEFDEALAGQSADVAFEVSDGTFVTERTWVVDLAP